MTMWSNKKVIALLPSWHVLTYMASFEAMYSKTVQNSDYSHFYQLHENHHNWSHALKKMGHRKHTCTQKTTNQNHFASGRSFAHIIKKSRSFICGTNQNNVICHVTSSTESGSVATPFGFSTQKPCKVVLNFENRMSDSRKVNLKQRSQRIEELNGKNRRSKAEKVAQEVRNNGIGIHFHILPREEQRERHHKPIRDWLDGKGDSLCVHSYLLLLHTLWNPRAKQRLPRFCVLWSSLLWKQSDRNNRWSRSSAF